MGYAFGLSVLHSEISKNINPRNENNTNYRINDNIINLNGVISLKLSTPAISKYRLMTEASFLFEPIPINSISIDKEFTNNEGSTYKIENKNKIIYTYFNPAFSLQSGLLYDIKKSNDIKLTLTLGLGLNSQNPYNTYYHTTIDNINLREYIKLKPNDSALTLFLRLSLVYY